MSAAEVTTRPSRSKGNPHARPEVRFQDEVARTYPQEEAGTTSLETEAEREVHNLQKLLLLTKQQLKETELERRSSITNLHEDFSRGSSSGSSRSCSPSGRKGSWLSHVSSLNHDQIEGLDRKARSSELDSTPARTSVDAMWKDWKAQSPQLRMSPVVVETTLPAVLGKPSDKEGHNRSHKCKGDAHTLCQEEMRRACDAMADMAKRDMLSLESELLEFTRAMENDFEQEKASAKAEMEQMRVKFRARVQALEDELANARKDKDKAQTKLQEELLTATQRNGRVALELSEEIQKRKRLERELSSWKDQAATMQQALECSDVRVGALEQALASALQRSGQQDTTDVLSSAAFGKPDRVPLSVVEDADEQAQWDVQVDQSMLAAAGSQDDHNSSGLFVGGIDEAERVLAMVGEEHAREIELMELQHKQAVSRLSEERDTLMAQVTAIKSQWAYQHHQAVKLRGLQEHGYGGVNGGLESVVCELAGAMQELAGLASLMAESPILGSKEDVKKPCKAKDERTVVVPVYSPTPSPSGGQNPIGNPSTPRAPAHDGVDGVKGGERGAAPDSHRLSVRSIGLPEAGLDSSDEGETASERTGSDIGRGLGAAGRLDFDRQVQGGLELLDQSSPPSSYSSVRSDRRPSNMATPEPPTSSSDKSGATTPSQEAQERLQELKRVAEEAMAVRAHAMGEARSRTLSLHEDPPAPPRPAGPPAGRMATASAVVSHGVSASAALPSLQAEEAKKAAVRAGAGSGLASSLPSTPKRRDAHPPARSAPSSASKRQTARGDAGLKVKLLARKAALSTRHEGADRSCVPHLSIASDCGGSEVQRTVAAGRTTHAAAQSDDPAQARRLEVTWAEWFEHEVYEGRQRFTMSCFYVDSKAADTLVLLGGATVPAGKLLALAMQGEGQADVRLALHDAKGQRVGELLVTVQICQ